MCIGAQPALAALLECLHDHWRRAVRCSAEQQKQGCGELIPWRWKLKTSSPDVASPGLAVTCGAAAVATSARPNTGPSSASRVTRAPPV